MPDPTPTTPGAADLHAAFLQALPRIETHARVVFRSLRCPDRRADAVAEVVALAWAWFLRATAQGKDVMSFIAVLATYAARHVRCGRRLCGQEPARDALSGVAQKRHDFSVESLATLDRCGQSSPGLEALRDNTRTPPDEQAAFRIDFPAWLGRLGDRNRRIAEEMAVGEGTGELARRHGTSPARISQLRREFRDDWRAFTGDAVTA